MTRGSATAAWRPLGDMTDHYWLVQRMAKACGVDTAAAVERGDLESNGWTEIVNACRSCQWVDGCQRWLDQQEPGQSTVPPAACVNAAKIMSLSEGQNQ